MKSGIFSASPIFLIVFLAHLCPEALAEHPAWNHLPIAAGNALSTAKDVTVFSLNPTWVPPVHRKKAFHYFEVLGAVTLSAPTDLVTIRTAIQNNVSAYDDLAYTSGFKPRHGLRIRTAKETFDFVISYDDSKLIVYVNDKALKPVLGIGGTPNILDDLLRTNKVPLPTRNHK